MSYLKQAKDALRTTISFPQRLIGINTSAVVAAHHFFGRESDKSTATLEICSYIKMLDNKTIRVCQLLIWPTAQEEPSHVRINFLRFLSKHAFYHTLIFRSEFRARVEQTENTP